MKTIVPPGCPPVANAARFVSEVKTPPPVLGTNRAFIRAWAARRAQVLVAAKPRAPK